MSVNSYHELRKHIGHEIKCVCYGIKGDDPANIALECWTCDEVLVDYDLESEEKEEETPSSSEDDYDICPGCDRHDKCKECVCEKDDEIMVRYTKRIEED